MGTTSSISMGDRGRIVLPVEVRRRAGIHSGTPLIVVDTADGIVLMTREQALQRVRADLAGSSLVDDLLAERRASALAEDVAPSV